MDKNLKIGIVGLGLIGGSIFKALCALECNVYGVSRSDETIKKASEYSPNVSTSMDILKECDVVFVCTPMNTTLEALDALEAIVGSKAIVSDVSSLKGFLCKQERPYQFIPTHPMAGTEFNGFDKSFESLFEGAKWVITPFEEVKQTDINTLKEIIQALGAIPIFSTPDKHDEAVALISHMPMLISQALFKAASGNELALKLASSGFRDMTRLALSNEEMAQDMMNLNADNIQNAVLNLYASVGELLGEGYKNKIIEIKKSRQSMYNDGVNVL